MRDATLCFPVRGGKVLLGMKKRGFGEGKFNGFGGKVEEGESVEEAALREMREEVGLNAAELLKVGELEFVFPHADGWDQLVHVFLVEEWDGEPRETEEMRPEWFPKASVPFHKMWEDDPHWLPLVLAGEKVDARFVFAEDNESVEEIKFKSPILP